MLSPRWDAWWLSAPWHAASRACAVALFAVLLVRFGLALAYRVRGPASRDPAVGPPTLGELWLATSLLLGTILSASLWWLASFAMGRVSGWAKVDLVFRTLVEAWPGALASLGLALGSWTLLLAWRGSSRVLRTRRPTHWLATGLTLGAVGAVSWGLAAYVSKAFAGESALTVSLEVAAAERASLARWLWGALGLLVVAGGLFAWAFASKGASGPAQTPELSARWHWLTTLLVASLGLLGSAALVQAGSLFAQENARPLDPRFAFANASLCCFGTLALDGAGPHDGLDAPLLEPGQPTLVDGSPSSDAAQVRDVLRNKRDLWLQVHGTPHPGGLNVNARRLSDVEQLQTTLALAWHAGYHRVALVFSQTRTEQRPLFGRLQGGRNSALTGNLAERGRECPAGSLPLALAPSASQPLAAWAAERAGQFRLDTEPCFLLAPWQCPDARPGCVDPRARGWSIRAQVPLGQDAMVLGLERHGQHFIAALLPWEARPSVSAMNEGPGGFESFPELAERLGNQGQRLLFAMNGGMYQPDRSAVGLLVIDGVEVNPLNTQSGRGNFFLQPNGVFAVLEGEAVVESTPLWRARGEDRSVRFATQSGPMLVEDGHIHPRFDPLSTSRVVRNGVCATGTGLVFAISTTRVNFHEFASFFRDLGCLSALYLDGNVSSLFAPATGRHDPGHGLGPVIVLSEPAADGLHRGE